MYSRYRSQGTSRNLNLKDLNRSWCQIKFENLHRNAPSPSFLVSHHEKVEVRRKWKNLRKRRRRHNKNLNHRGNTKQTESKDFPYKTNNLGSNRNIWMRFFTKISEWSLCIVRILSSSSWHPFFTVATSYWLSFKISCKTEQKLAKMFSISLL